MNLQTAAALAFAPALAASHRIGRIVLSRIVPRQATRAIAVGEGKMTVHFIGAGPGAADLITVRGRDLIGRCGVCLYAGATVPAQVLEYCPPGARVVDASSLSLDEIVEEFRLATEQGLHVACLQSGDLSIWSSVGEQFRRLKELGIAYTVTPGVPSFAAAAAELGQELTLPEAASSVVLTRTDRVSSAMPPSETLASFAATGATLAIHLSSRAIDVAVADLLPHYGGDCPVAVVCRATWPDQRVIRATLATIAAELVDAGLEQDALVLVGKVFGERGFGNSAPEDADDDRRVHRRGA